VLCLDDTAAPSLAEWILIGGDYETSQFLRRVRETLSSRVSPSANAGLVAGYEAR